jgi:PAS domain S-box-containing protein
VGYVTLGPDGRILEANLGAALMLGVDRRALLRSDISSFVAPDARDDCYLHQTEVFGSETKKTCELEMHEADGTPLVVRWESIAFGPPGERRCRTALIDVTAARSAQREREESEERYRRLTDALTDHIYRVRVETRRPAEITHGGNCEAITGYTAEELAANPRLWAAMVPPEDRPAVEEQITGILSGREAPPLEHRIRGKDGTIRWVLNTISPERDHQGRIVAYDGLLRDISKRKRAEEAIQKLNEELEQRVAQRTAELEAANDALRSLSARLLRAEESERRRISRELHDDFSQRLAMLSVAIESLKAVEGVAPETSRRLQTMGKTVAEIAEDCHRLAYSLHPSILDHLGLSAALRRYAQELSAHQGIEVVLRERGFPRELDAGKASCLYRIAQEALSNVARHSMSPRATLRLIGGARAVRLTVRDYGEGFDVNERRRRAETLGLVSMEERAHLIGGTLTIQSAPGKNTIIRATCPLERA